MIKLKKRLDPFKVMPICLGLIGTDFKEKAVTVAGKDILESWKMTI